MADLLQTTDAKTASEMVQAQYGSLLSEDSLPAVAAQADRLGWAQYQQDAAPLIQNFQNNPTQANLDSLNAMVLIQRGATDLQQIPLFLIVRKLQLTQRRKQVSWILLRTQI